MRPVRECAITKQSLNHGTFEQSIKSYAKHAYPRIFDLVTFIREPSCSLGFLTQIYIFISGFTPGLWCNTVENQFHHVHTAGK